MLYSVAATPAPANTDWKNADLVDLTIMATLYFSSGSPPENPMLPEKAARRIITATIRRISRNAIRAASILPGFLPACLAIFS